VAAGADDAISLDNHPVGTQRWEGQVAAGDHSVRIQHPGKKTYELALTLRDKETRRLDITLSPEGTSPWLYVAGASVLAIGAAVGGYFLFKPAPEGSDPSGTLGTAYPALLRSRGH
jgi:PEGA domain